MIGMQWDLAAIQLTKARFEQFRSALRRRIMLKVGNAAAKPILKELKAESFHDNTGTLRKNLGSKVKAYSDIVFVAAGPKNTKLAATSYRDYRTGQMRAWQRGGPARPRYQNPARYAHLAGPGRKGIFVTRVQDRMKSQTVATISRVLTDEVAKI